MFRGPKPPIAPKPRLDAPHEWRASVYINNSLNKCSNGKLLCVDSGLDTEQRSNLECSESEADEDYIVIPKASLREDKPPDEGCAENEVLMSPGAPGDEEVEEERGAECTVEGTGTGEDRTLSTDSDGGVDQATENMAREEDCEEAEERALRQEEEKPVEEHNEYSQEDQGPWDREEVFQSDIVLTQVELEDPAAPGEGSTPPDMPLEVEEDSEKDSVTVEPGGPDEQVDCHSPIEAESAAASSEPTEQEDLASEVLESDETVENLEVAGELGEDSTVEGGLADDIPPDPDESMGQEVDEEPQGGGGPTEDEPAEESYQIIPFENDSIDSFMTSLTGSPYEFFPTESTSFCSESYSPFPKSAEGLESEQESKVEWCAPGDPEARTECGQRDPVESPACEGPSVPEVEDLPEDNLDKDTVDDSLTNPYVIGVGLACWAGQCEMQTGANALSGYGTREDASSDVEGNLLSIDRKNLVTRVRPHSGKVAGYVPETVPEESGPEAGSAAVGSRGTIVETKKTGSSLEGKLPEATSRALPAKPRAFTLYPRSFSVEGREIPFSLFHEADGYGLDDPRIKREDNLSLPCMIGSSGSFSQRNHLPSSGTSTPSSVVDIPPPFDLACITKKPITKSSPSLLTESHSPDPPTKKKKSSFKQFLALTFKKKVESKVHVEVNVSSSRSSSESSYHGPARLLDMERRSLSNSPQLKSRTGKLRASESPSSLIFYRDAKRRGVPFSRTVSRVESFEDRSRPPFLPLPLTKPRSISFPNADTSDYENIPAMNSDYENIQIPPRRPARAGTFTKLFEDQSRALSTANENDGYVDMSSFNAFESKQQSADQDTESAYTEPYKVCPISAAAPKEDLTSDEEQASSEEEESAPRGPSLTHKVEGQSRAHVIAQELLSSEKIYVEMLQHLHLDFHGAIMRTLDEMDQEGKDTVSREALRLGLSYLPAIHELHRGILEQLEERLEHWEGQQKVADIFLAQEQGFDHHAAHVLQFDRYLGLLNENCRHSPRLAAAVREFEGLQEEEDRNVKHWLLRVVQRLFQYQVLLTDYLNNLCPDSTEYQNTQGALTLISKVTDCVHDSMEQGENLQKLVHIEYSVQGQGDLLQPGREFLKEGTLMKVTGKNRRPRHLFLMSDVLLYTYPQKDGKYRLKSSLVVASMKVSRPVMEKVPYALRIETAESCLTLSASSCAERDEWYSCLSRALPEDYKAQALAVFHHSVEMRERLGVSLGERPPTLVPVTHVMMCMNCGCDFSLTLRRHHCHACGKIVCRKCSRNKYPLKYLKDRMAKVCDGCYGKLKKRGGDFVGLMRERPVSMSFPLSSPRFSGSAFSSVFHSINPSTFRKQKKIPSALAEVAASGEGSAISGYLSRNKKGKRHWKKLWFVIKGKVLYTYMASEDKVAMESMPLLGFTIVPEKEEGSSEVGPIFHLYHKKTLFYSFKAEDTSAAQRWIEAMDEASVL
ncbi:PREDICTED: FYVE, RhoGEF and PH domain-containing protein 5 [Chrysochloris asiatica]|uniref:FYVE, RhoGEF and PH domain-containing protein 5 n=1 Tax=Chrysochloris asiatica TaxID=185453 RepID=A0A9B0TQT4_CHRAS|nr:PREDICTED: FYVE, RhoGEF and PH domain-containing protein 5 [Chrysochloris asiatica]